MFSLNKLSGKYKIINSYLVNALPISITTAGLSAAIDIESVSKRVTTPINGIFAAVIDDDGEARILDDNGDDIMSTKQIFNQSDQINNQILSERVATSAESIIIKKLPESRREKRCMSEKREAMKLCNVVELFCSID